MPKKKITPIRYTARDFNSIKESLVEYTKRYYPNSFKDFNDASFGSLMLDTVAYVGDILSFYLDYQANETFLDTAIEFDNVVKLARQLGYKYPGRPTAQGELTLYILAPANDSGTGPDSRYMPALRRSSLFSTPSHGSFMLTEDIDFSHSRNDIVVAKTNAVTGIPTQYAVKATGRIISGFLRREIVEVGDYSKFKKIEVPGGEAISEIISVTDSQGNEYFEVDYLSQDVIYAEFSNPEESDLEFAPKIMKPIQVPRRFVLDRKPGETFLQFGFGSESDLTSDLIVDPTNVLLKMHGKNYISDTSFDPYNFISSDKFGVVPANTNLNIIYRANNSDSSNAPVATITDIVLPKFKFKNAFELDNTKMRDVIDSLEVINEVPILGDTQYINSDNIKTQALGAFYSQNRAVTAQDYKTLTYSMDPKFGSVFRCNIMLDADSNKRNLNLYLISKNNNQKLITTNSSIKENLKTWLSKYKMISDTIDILDARILNIGINFSVLSEAEENKSRVLNKCLNALDSYFSTLPEIGEPIHITKIYNILNNVPGVVDTSKVDVYQKSGNNYSDIKFSISSNLSSDRRYVIIPKNVIYEIKYRKDDIKGTVS